MPDQEGRIYSNYMANIIIEENGQRIITPMRYRIRPKDSPTEIPSKYNVFNARVDALEQKKTWQKIFMKNHGVIPFVKFYEWVEDENSNKKLISFFPKNHEIMWAPILFDIWQSDDKKITLPSFAIITDEPAPEILKMGHDRCPIFLKKENIEKWLNPSSETKKSIYEILKAKEDVYYGYEFC